MLRLLLFNCFIFIAILSYAETITVGDIKQLNEANKNAKPGDIIVLKNGEWKDVTIKLNCNGTATQPIIFRAETAGKVMISGHSRLALGGSFLTIDGLYFTNGFAGDDAVITFSIDKKQLANNCRITNTVINDFNNPKRNDENYWVAFYGKRNRMDHCSFMNKKNLGVLMAVILDDDRSRENFHSIDHNYFGFRLPLASNSGEMIRVGVSQHCEFNSNTQITDNFFEHCDGETEIVSIKSCSNMVKNNLFKECQGGVVLRHGNYNTVENNIFWGNNKPGTGGVRIINKGQWVINNLFYKCRGEGFRSPLSLMNGVKNSPANRYVEVSDAVVMNNSFIDCTPISLCEGSDTERTVAPHQVIFANNLFYNTVDKKIYNRYDDISGIDFENNRISKQFDQEVANGFIKTSFTLRKFADIVLPVSTPASTISDSLQSIAKPRLELGFSGIAGYNYQQKYSAVKNNAATNCGALWFKKMNVPVTQPIKNIKVGNAIMLKQQLANADGKMISITLTAGSYLFTEPLVVAGNVSITSAKKTVRFVSTEMLSTVFELKGNGSLTFKDLAVDLADLKATHVVVTDQTGTSNHVNFKVLNSSFTNGSATFFNASKSVVLDSVIVTNSTFSNNTHMLFNFTNETDKKGYYNVEKIKLINNIFSDNTAPILGMLRGGNDESTMGPLLIFSNNKITNSNSNEPSIKLYGTQLSTISHNTFTNSNKNGTVLMYEDAVRAVHMLTNNKFISSGKVETDKYVTEQKNTNQ